MREVLVLTPPHRKLGEVDSQKKDEHSRQWSKFLTFIFSGLWFSKLALSVGQLFSAEGYLDDPLIVVCDLWLVAVTTFMTPSSWFQRHIDEVLVLDRVCAPSSGWQYDTTKVTVYLSFPLSFWSHGPVVLVELPPIFQQLTSSLMVWLHYFSRVYGFLDHVCWGWICLRFCLCFLGWVEFSADLPLHLVPQLARGANDLVKQMLAWCTFDLGWGFPLAQ